MSEREKGKNIPLPSIFSNIRNAAGRSSSIFQYDTSSKNTSSSSSRFEIEPLVSTGESSSSPPSSPSNLLTSKRRNANSLSFLLDRVQSMPLFDKSRSRIRTSRGNKRSRRGFQVDLPPKFLLYTVFVFIICPLLLGAFFLVKQIVFGSLQEDETHPLHKKLPHVKSGAGNATSSNDILLRNEKNETSLVTMNQRLGDKVSNYSSDEKYSESNDHLLQHSSTPTNSSYDLRGPSTDADLAFTDVPSASTNNEDINATSTYPSFPSSN